MEEDINLDKHSKETMTMVPDWANAELSEDFEADGVRSLYNDRDIDEQLETYRLTK